MISGFVKLDGPRFYREVWAQIKDRAEAIESNLKDIRDCKKSDIPAPPLLIHWGCKDKTTGEITVLAISRSPGNSPDEHWAAPHLIES